jgi:hypothetical protein
MDVFGYKMDSYKYTSMSSKTEEKKYLKIIVDQLILDRN